MPPSISPSSNPSSTPAQISATDKNPAMGVSPASTISHRPGPQNAFVRADTYISVDAYFKGPRNTSHHSKLPMFMRLYGSVIPRMIIPMLVLAGWSTLITCLCQFVYPLVVNTVLLTVLGLIVGLAISFRTSSGYERYIEGRKYWAQLSQAARDLGRHLWVHVRERADAGEATAKHDLLGKLTALNLIVAFAVALKHKLRFEPYAHYPDLEHRVRHLDSFAAAAYDAEAAGPTHVKRSWLKTVAGEYLDISFAESNPREALQRSTRNLGNLPLEVLLHLSAYVESLAADGTLAADGRQGLVMADLAVLNEVLAGTERILNTPLPLAYSIAISQITWIYCLALPFQLWQSLGWITIPGTVIGGFIMLGIAAIGREIEDPFGHDVNDLPLDRYCQELAADMDVIAARPAPQPDAFVRAAENKVLYPMHVDAYADWHGKSVDEIREALRVKAGLGPMREAVKAEGPGP